MRSWLIKVGRGDGERGAGWLSGLPGPFLSFCLALQDDDQYVLEEEDGR